MKKTNPVWYVMIVITIWCTWNTAGRYGLVSTLSNVEKQQQLVLREFAYLTDRIQALENIEPEVIIKEVKVEVPVEVIKEVIKEVEVIKEIPTEVDDE